MANIAEINERLVHTAQTIATRTHLASITDESNKGELELIIRLNSLTSPHTLLTNGLVSKSIEQVTGGASQYYQWLIDTYYEFRLSCFDDQQDWDNWVEYLANSVPPINGSSVLPPEIKQLLGGQTEARGVLNANPWLISFFVFPQLALEIINSKRKPRG